MNFVISPADMHVRKNLNIFVIVSNAVSVNRCYLAENMKKIQISMHSSFLGDSKQKAFDFKLMSTFLSVSVKIWENNVIHCYKTATRIEIRKDMKFFEWNEIIFYSLVFLIKLIVILILVHRVAQCIINIQTLRIHNLLNWFFMLY